MATRAAMRGRITGLRTWRLTPVEILGAVALIGVIAILAAPPAWREAVTGLWNPSAAAAPTPPTTGALTGLARVVDGDTLTLNGQRIRLFGIDAFERDQTCGAGASSWACGQAGTQALTRRLDGRTVACEPLDTDRYGRTVARCRTGGEDIGAWMVERGLAVAYRQYSLDYVDAENRAREARLGVWRNADFTTPQDWRQDWRATR